MGDKTDGVWGTLFGAYGTWSVAGALVLGLVVWGASHVVAQPGSPVNVLWGTTSYTKSCSNDSQGACKEQSSRCASIGGRWRRDDNAIFNLTQNGCNVQGFVESVGGGNSQRLVAIVSGNTAIGYNERLFNACTTFMSNDYKILSSDRLEIIAQGNGCDLQNWHEDTVYHKIL